VRLREFKDQWSVTAQPCDLEPRCSSRSKIVNGIPWRLHPWAMVSPTMPAPAMRTWKDGGAMTAVSGREEIGKEL